MDVIYANVGRNDEFDKLIRGLIHSLSRISNTGGSLRVCADIDDGSGIIKSFPISGCLLAQILDLDIKRAGLSDAQRVWFREANDGIETG
jgi:hypothetical protein